MANRSNRHWETPPERRTEEFVCTFGNRCANSPLWSDVANSINQRPNIRRQTHLLKIEEITCKRGEVHTRSAAVSLLPMVLKYQTSLSIPEALFCLQWIVRKVEKSLKKTKKIAAFSGGDKLTKRRESYEKKYSFTIHAAQYRFDCAPTLRYLLTVNQKRCIFMICVVFATALVWLMPK